MYDRTQQAGGQARGQAVRIVAHVPADGEEWGGGRTAMEAGAMPSGIEVADRLRTRWNWLVLAAVMVAGEVAGVAAWKWVAGWAGEWIRAALR
jgi:hypothetical protein